MRQTIGNLAFLIGWLSLIGGLIIWLIIVFTRSGEYDLHTGIFSFATLAYLILGIPTAAAALMLFSWRWKGAILLWLTSVGFILLVFGQRLLGAFGG